MQGMVFLDALLGNLGTDLLQFREDEVDNEIALTAFRLLVMDLLVFFHVVNEGVINVLGMWWLTGSDHN